MLKPYLRMFRDLSKTNLPGYVGFFQFLRNFHQLTAFEQAEMVLYAALDPTVASRAKKGGIRHVFGPFRAATIPYKLSEPLYRRTWLSCIVLVMNGITRHVSGLPASLSGVQSCGGSLR